VLAVLADVVADALGLGAVDKVLAQSALDLGKVLVEGLLGALVVDEILQHIARKLVHAGVEGEAFIDNLAAEDVFEVEVHEGDSSVALPT